LPVLWKGVNGHSDQRSCFTCHNHGVPMLAFATARGRGFDVPEKQWGDLIEFITDDLERNRLRFLKGQGPGPSPAGGETDNTGYALLALDAAGYKPDAKTAAVAHFTLTKHKDRDFWATHGNRPPSEVSSFTTTALSLRGLQRFATVEQQEQVAQRIAKARDWLSKTPAKDTEDRVFKLLGLKAAGAEAGEIRRAAKELIAMQRDNGGWGQTDKRDSDAYATGSALYALHIAGGLATNKPVYQRGLKFLLGTQHEDGSWHVRSRSRPFQTYFESGFPHKKDQFISCAATAWATTALALAYSK